MFDKRKCKYCNHYEVYCEHILKNDKWRMYCRKCGKTTAYHNTHNEAEKEWESMKVDAENKVG